MPLPILMYHEISPKSQGDFQKYIVSPRQFTMQMRWLRFAGYRPMTLTAVLAARRDGSRLPHRCVLITFDDGFHDCAQYAPHILQAHGFVATFFLVAGLVGQTSRWLVHERGLELPLADWATARALVSAGFECGAHSLTHPRLTALSDDMCRHELEISRHVLEDRLGQQVVHLAYPFGAYDARVRRLAECAGYQTACTADSGIASAIDDPLTLRRVPISGHDTLADFIWRLRTGLSLRDAYGRWRAGLPA